MTRGHADALFPMIDEVLAETALAPTDLTRIAVCTGPGSFTGLRVGISAARGLALALGVPSVGITRFEAVAPPGFVGEVRLAARGGMRWVQSFAHGAPVGAPRQEPGEAEDVLPDPLAIARLAAGRTPSERPAPLYLRDADAVLPSVPAPALLD